MKFIALLLLTPFINLVGDAYTVVPRHRSKTMPVPALSFATVDNNIDDSIARLQKEYKLLQEELLRDDLLLKDMLKADEVSEAMVEKAADMAALYRYKQQELIDSAEKERLRALEESHRAHNLAVQLHEEALITERDSKLIESFDDAYEDLERWRDQSSAHAAYDLESDVHELDIENQFLQLEAEALECHAKEVLKRVQAYENSLRNTLKEMRHTKTENATRTWKEEAKKHESFIAQVKDLLHKRSQEG